MTAMKVRKFFILIGLLLTVHHFAAKAAEPTGTWPQRPVTLIVPFSVGGATDQFARLLAPYLSAFIGQAIVIDNVVGAGGAIGVRKLTTIEPDGHVLLLGGVSETVLIPLSNQSSGYKPQDLQAVSIGASTALVLAARRDFPAQSMGDIVKLAHASPMKYTYGSAGVGSYGHLMLKTFAQELGIDLLHVPYKGSGQMLTDMVSGQIDLALTSLPSVVPFAKTDRIKLISVSAPHRLVEWPNLPTFTESALTQEPISLWGGVFAPRGLPPEIGFKINSVFTEILKDKGLRAKLIQLGIVPEKPRSLSESQNFYERQIRQYQSLATAP